jgi:hypothetical protein
VAAKHRPPFLAVFLTLLTVAFAAALAYRVRAYREMESGVPAVPATASSVDAPAAGRAETFELHPVESAPEGGRAHAVAPAVSREQRYRELLALGSTPEAAAMQSAAEAQQKRVVKPAAAPPPKPESALAKLFKPIVNAVTGNKPQPQPAQPTSVDTATTTSTQPEEPKDPNSDSAPPQLISVEFNPPQINDGEETTLIVTAMDDLSGIRGISGTITSPTGKALQGFAQQREGETNRYVSRVAIPKEAEEGMWRISFLNLSDHATNMTTLNYAQGTIPQNAVLRVTSSKSDSQPPTLRAVSIGRQAMRSGEPNTLFVQADDDKSGVKLISAVFVSPAKQARLGYGCKRADGDNWECVVNPSECIDCGEWQLEQIQMQDNANNYVTVRQENPLVAAVRLNIAGASCDSTPPVLQSVVLDKQYVALAQGENTVTIRAMVTDDGCGVGGLSGQVLGPGTNSGTFFAFTPEGTDGTYVGTVKLDPKAPRGIWKIQSITVNDKGQNLRIYYASDPVLGRGQFVVR